MTSSLQALIDAAWEDRARLSPSDAPSDVRAAVAAVVDELNAGRLRVATREGVGQWTVHQWVKKAVLLSFRLNDNQVSHAGPLTFFDKVDTKFSHLDDADLRAAGVRIVPPAVARHGSFIGRNVHLSGGVGIGGVLEPLQANPTIIEDNCFIGARSEVVEGVIVEEGSVISMGVYISQSTKIYDRATGQVTYGRIPAGSVVVSGSIPAPDGSHSLYCAVIVKRVDAGTRAKTSINELLRA